MPEAISWQKLKRHMWPGASVFLPSFSMGRAWLLLACSRPGSTRVDATHRGILYRENARSNRHCKGEIMRILYIHSLNRVAEIHGGNLTRRGHSVTVYRPQVVHAPFPVKLAMMPRSVFVMRHAIADLNLN